MGHRGAREGVGGLLGIGVAVARRVEASGPPAGEPGDDRQQVGGRDDAAVQAEVARHGQPLLEERHALVIGGEREVAALHPLDVRAQLGLEPAPEAVRLHHEGQLARVPALLAHEAPVLPRLLAVHRRPLHDGHAQPPSGQEIGSRATDDARSDDDDVCVPIHKARP